MSFNINHFADLYPFRSHYMNLDGLSYHYVDEGHGDPVIMLHGNPTWSFFYRDLISGLRDSYRVVAPDHIGCGLSSKPSDRQYIYTLNSRIRDLENFLDQLELRSNLTLVMHDWGGAIGMGYAARHPERVRRLVIFNTAAFLLPSGRGLPGVLAFVRDRALGAVLTQGINAFAYLTTYFACAKPMPEHVRDAYLGPYNSWKNRTALLRFVQDIPLEPGDPSFSAVKNTQEKLDLFAGLPALICWGEQDFVFDEYFLDEWRKHLPGAEVRTFSDAGHFVLEDASDRVVPLVRSFLQQHPIGKQA